MSDVSSVGTGGVGVCGNPIRNRNFRRWLIGSSISVLGDQFYVIALPWLVLEKFGSASMLGTLMMASAIPRAVLLLVGGAITDRASARWVMVATASIRAICVAATGVLATKPSVDVMWLYLIVVTFGVADAFAMPAQSAYIPALLQPEQLTAGTGLSQATAQVTGILGPLAAGVLIGRYGVASAFFFDAASFIVVIGTLLTLPDPPRNSPSGSAISAIREGLTYVARDTSLLAMVLMAMVVNLCVAGPLTVGIAEIAKVVLQSAASFGFLIVATGVGGLAGAILAGIWKVRRRGIVILVCSGLIGICLAGIAIEATHVFALVVVLSLLGGVAGFVNIHIGAWVMGRIDTKLRGRVSSVLILVSLGAAPLSMALAGFAVAGGLSSMFLVAAAVLLIATGIATWSDSIRCIA